MTLRAGREVILWGGIEWLEAAVREFGRYFGRLGIRMT